ncbi:hypothetical protein PISL3812_07907 [Talaromyces islandicus]|uniref:HNH nuclease domain-containing protein n=1 Tax=Talaromyces islandicus TaxID=28573 RepID=A0A0U1M727_TALIS|nr:hypothetical protein PISL3812_07907 [Talaromyces islandicus]
MFEVSNDSDSFPPSVKLQCRESTDDKCWVCGLTPVEVAHVVAKNDRATRYLQNQGLINFSLTSALNAVTLCPTCRANFDLAMDPGWFFVPSDLQYFIDFEEKDFARRTHDRNHGIVTTRVCPTSDEYAASQPQGIPQYIRVILQDEVVCVERMRVKAAWFGAPIAAIRRAFIALGSVRRSGIPKDISEKLWKLQDLYYRSLAREPQLAAIPSTMIADLSVPQPSLPLKRLTEEENEQELNKDHTLSPLRLEFEEYLDPILFVSPDMLLSCLLEAQTATTAFKRPPTMMPDIIHKFLEEPGRPLPEGLSAKIYELPDDESSRILSDHYKKFENPTFSRSSRQLSTVMSSPEKVTTAPTSTSTTRYPSFLPKAPPADLIIHQILTYREDGHTERTFEWSEVEEHTALTVYNALQRQEEGRGFRCGWNSLLKTFSVVTMVTEIHECLASWMGTMAIEMGIAGFLTLQDVNDLLFLPIAESRSFRGQYQGSIKQPDYTIRPAVATMPTIVCESGWSESAAKLREDMRIWLIGGRPHVQAVFVAEFSKRRDGRVAGIVEQFEPDPNGDIRSVQKENIFPAPSNAAQQRMTITRGHIWGVHLPAGQNKNATFHLSVDKFVDLQRLSWLACATSRLRSQNFSVQHSEARKEFSLAEL